MAEDEAPKVGRPPKVEPYHSMKQITRTISDVGTFNAGSWPIEKIDEYVSSWLDRGYHLASTHFLGKVAEGWSVLYVLVK